MIRVVFDTSYLLSDLNSLSDFIENGSEVIIPIGVVQELDRMKPERTERGFKARVLIKKLDVFGESIKYVQNIIPSDTDNLLGLDPLKVDAQIILTALKFDATIYSNDLSLCIIARAAGVNAVRKEDLDENLELEPHITGYAVSSLFSNKKERAFKYKIYSDIENFDYDFQGIMLPKTPYVNQPVVIKCFDNNASLLGVVKNEDYIKIIDSSGIKKKMKQYIEPKNAEQTFALEFLLDKDVELVNLLGRAGSGKTTLAVASGLLQALEDKTYDCIAITKSVVSTSEQDIGFLPGTVQEKFGPIIDNVKDIIEGFIGAEYDQLFGRQIRIEPLAFIRGKNLNNMFLIVDEAQNLSEEDLLTILSRAGSGTKIVLTGDPTQCDVKNLTLYNTGIMKVIKAFKGQDLSSTVILKSSQRQRLATLATELLGAKQRFWS